MSSSRCFCQNMSTTRLLRVGSTEAAAGGWATCVVTDLGAVRVCAQLPGGSWPPASTADRLLVLTASSRGYVWWADILSPTLLPEIRGATTAKQVTDRYLLGSFAGTVAGSRRSIARSPILAAMTWCLCYRV